MAVGRTKSSATAIVARQRLVDGAADGGLALQAEAAGGVALRIDVDEEDGVAGEREGGGEVDGRGGLADAALLVGDGYHLSFQRVMRHCAAMGLARILAAALFLVNNQTSLACSRETGASIFHTIRPASTAGKAPPKVRAIHRGPQVGGDSFHVEHHRPSEILLQDDAAGIGATRRADRSPTSSAEESARQPRRRRSDRETGTAVRRVSGTPGG